MSEKLTSQQRIEEAKIIWDRDNDYAFTESELHALLLQVQDEQKEICWKDFLNPKLPPRSSSVGIEPWRKLSQAEVRERILNAPYAYDPQPETEE